MKQVIFILLFLMIVPFVPTVFSQLSVGEPANQKKLEITISDDNKVHVVHEIHKSSFPQSLVAVKGSISELEVVGLDGNEKEFATSGNTDGTTIITIFPTNQDVLVEYELDDALLLKNGVWTWEYLYLYGTKFIFPDFIKLIYVNGNPINIENVHNISCHGCQMVLEYIVDIPTTQKQIKWDEQTFLVSIETLGDVSSINFHQPSKSLSFYNEGNQTINIMIPKELLGSPYEVFLEESKILKHEFMENDTHNWLNIRPHSHGNIQVIGTTVIPEFSLFLPLILGILIVIMIQMKSKIILR